MPQTNHPHPNMTAFLDNLSPASLISPNTDCSQSSQDSRSPSLNLIRKSPTEDSSTLTGIPNKSETPTSELNNEPRSQFKSERGSQDWKAELDKTPGFYREQTSFERSRSMERVELHRAFSSQSESSLEQTNGRPSPFGLTNGRSSSLERMDKSLEGLNKLSFDSLSSSVSCHGDHNNNNTSVGMETADDEKQDGRLEISGNHVTSTPNERFSELVDSKDHVFNGNELSKPSDRSSSIRDSRDSRDSLRDSLDSTGSPDAMDLSSSREAEGDEKPISLSGGRTNPDDLALSPPHSYTAQVRDVIRSRILAGKPNGSAFNPVVKSEKSETHKENDPNNNIELDSTPKVMKHMGMQPKRLDGLTGSEFMKDRSMSGHGEPLSLVMDAPRMASPLTVRRDSGPVTPGATSPLLSPMLPGESSSMARSLAMQLGLHPSPLAVMAQHSMNLFNAAALMDGKSPYSMPPLLRPGSTPNSHHPAHPHRGLSPVGMYHLGMSGPSPLPSPGSQRDSSAGSPTDLGGLDEDGREVGPNGEQRVYRCEYCNKTFLFKSKYHEHLPVHTNARPFRCHLCARTYKYKYDLRVHLRTHMGIPTKSTVCPFCSAKFDTNKHLRQHIKDAHKDKQKASEMECTQPVDNLPPAL